MAVEVEAKMKVDDLAEMRARLTQAGAVLLGDRLETNTFFDTPGRDLLAGDRGLRLRSMYDPATGHTEHTLTHKGPQQPGALKIRQETELTVGDDQSARALLEQLGYVAVFTFEKKRQSWQYGDCRVELDEVQPLGTFVEIEGPGEQAIMAARAALGLADRPIIRTSYIAMLAGDAPGGA